MTFLTANAAKNKTVVIQRELERINRANFDEEFSILKEEIEDLINASILEGKYYTSLSIRNIEMKKSIMDFLISVGYEVDNSLNIAPEVVYIRWKK